MVPPMSKLSASLNKLKKHFIRATPGTTGYMERLRARRDAADAMVVVRNTGGVRTGTLIWLNGGEEWFLEDKLHRDREPAIIRPDGTRLWFQKGLLHNDNGPAIVYPDGKAEWWKDGEPVKGPGQVAPPPPTAAQKALSELVEAATNGTAGRVVISKPLKLRTR